MPDHEKWPQSIFDIFKIIAKLKIFIFVLVFIEFQDLLFLVKAKILNQRTNWFLVNLNTRTYSQEKRRDNWKQISSHKFLTNPTEVPLQNDVLFLVKWILPLSDVKWLNYCFPQKDSWLGFARLYIYLVKGVCDYLLSEKEEKQRRESTSLRG